MGNKTLECWMPVNPQEGALRHHRIIRSASSTACGAPLHGYISYAELLNLGRKRAIASTRRLSDPLDQRSRHLSLKGVFFIRSHLPSLQVNFQHHPVLLEPAMRASHSKRLKAEPPRDFGSRLEVFLSREMIPSAHRISNLGFCCLQCRYGRI